MAHSIELLLDQRADAAVRQMWRTLADAGLPNQLNVTSDTNRPHITLVAAERIAPDVDDRLAELADHFPLRAVLGAPLVFGGGRLTLARLVVASEALLALHQQVHDICRPFVSSLFPHSQPAQWTPHITLGRRFTPRQIGDAMATSHEISAQRAVTVAGLRRWDGDAKVERVLIE